MDSKNNQKEYGVRIFEVCNKAARNSELNKQKIINCGLAPLEKNLISEKENIWCYVGNRRNEIFKIFYWGNRFIKEETAKRRLGYKG